MRSSVVLPAPRGPISPWISPGFDDQVDAGERRSRPKAMIERSELDQGRVHTPIIWGGPIQCTRLWSRSSRLVDQWRTARSVHLTQRGWRGMPPRSCRCRASPATSARRWSGSPSRRERLGLEVDLHEHDLAALRAHPGHPGEEAPRDSLWGLTATLPGRARGRLCLNGHVDVVGPGNEEWRFGPWSGAIEDGRLHGRGALDMKGAVVAAHARGGGAAATSRRPRWCCRRSPPRRTAGLARSPRCERDAAFDAALLPEPTALRRRLRAGGRADVPRGRPRPRRARRRAARGRLGDRPLRARPRRAAGARGDGERGRHAPAHARAGAPVPAAGRAALPAGEWSSMVPDRLEFEGRLGRAGRCRPGRGARGAAGRCGRRARRRRAAVRARVGGRRLRAWRDRGGSPVGGRGAERAARRDRARPSWPACRGARTCGCSRRAGSRR